MSEEANERESTVSQEQSESTTAGQVKEKAQNKGIKEREMYNEFTAQWREREREREKKKEKRKGSTSVSVKVSGSGSSSCICR